MNIKNGKSGEDSPRLLPRMQKTLLERGNGENSPAFLPEKKVGEGGMLPLSHLCRATVGEIGRTLCSLVDSGFYREDQSELYQKDNGVREVLINT